MSETPSYADVTLDKDEKSFISGCFMLYMCVYIYILFWPSLKLCMI